MWIKTKDGDYYNMEYSQTIYMVEKDFTRIAFDGRVVCVQGDQRDTIVQNIISGTKLMEVE